MTRNLRLVEFHARAWEALGSGECEAQLTMLDGVAMLVICVPQPEITSPVTIEAPVRWWSTALHCTALHCTLAQCGALGSGVPPPVRQG